VHASCIGVPYPRMIEKRLEEDTALAVPAANSTPDFLLGGEEKVRSQWQLICMGHNVLEPFKGLGAGLPGRKLWRQAVAA
jgi:hypothetical protein